jgi:hypothetical protein
VIKRLLELAGSGLKIILKKTPKEPGAVPHPDYLSSVNQLKKLKNVSIDLPVHMTPFISGDIIPHHWCRKDGEALYIFFPNPKAERIKFPLEYGQSLNSKNREIKINLHYDGTQIDLNLAFKPYQSLLYKIENGKAKQIDIEFVPKTPDVRKRPEGYQAPWLVK